MNSLASSFLIGSSLCFACNEDMHESLDEFEFRQICNRVTALDLRENLVFAQYLENE